MNEKIYFQNSLTLSSPSTSGFTHSVNIWICWYHSWCHSLITWCHSWYQWIKHMVSIMGSQIIRSIPLIVSINKKYGVNLGVINGISGLTHDLISVSTGITHGVINWAYGMIHSAINSSPDLAQSVVNWSCIQYLVTLRILVMVLVALNGVNIWSIWYHSFCCMLRTWSDSWSEWMKYLFSLVVS